jgi:hypothetical protein
MSPSYYFFVHLITRSVVILSDVRITTCIYVAAPGH